MCDKLPYENPRIDSCLLATVALVKTSTAFVPVASCCGHNKYPRTLVVKCPDGSMMEYFSKIPLQKRKRNRYYTKDSEGYYFIKELQKART